MDLNLLFLSLGLRMPTDVKIGRSALALLVSLHADRSTNCLFGELMDWD
jgi:hypothetical protein